MKKALSILIIIVAIVFLGLTLYVFEVPPFHPGGPFIQTEPAGVTINRTPLPTFLQDEQEGVSRTKTFSEHMNRGDLLTQNGYHALAITEYETAAQLSPTNPQPLINIGELQLQAGDFLKAKVSLEAALKRDTENLEANIVLGRVFIADRKTDDAKQIFDNINIHNQESKYYQGLLASFTGDHNGAKNLLREALSLNPSSTLAPNIQGVISAYDEFDINQGGADVHLKTLLARSYNQAGEFQLAIPLLFDVIKNKKDYRDAWIVLGYAYLSTQKYQDATEAFEEAQQLDPQKAEIPFFLGLSYAGLGQLENAIAQLELAKENGYQPQVQVDQKLAEIYLQLQQYEESAASYERVLELNDEHVSYFIKPIWIYLEQLDQPEKAVALAQKAFNSNPTEAMSYNLMGWAKIGANEFNEAKQYLDQAIALDPQLDAVHLNYGLLAEKQGAIQQALEHYNNAYELGQARRSSVAAAAAENYNRLVSAMSNSGTFQTNVFGSSP